MATELRSSLMQVYYCIYSPLLHFIALSPSARFHGSLLLC